MICAIIPTLNSQEYLPMLLKQLAGGVNRIVVSDGGSEDDTIAEAVKAGALIVAGEVGRGHQLALGASWSGEAEWFFFLHCDNRLPEGWEKDVTGHISGHSDKAAYFRYRANAAGFWPRFVNFWVGMRCYWWGLPYGDQGLLMSKEMYEAIGGYQQIPLFEDVAMIDAIKQRYGRRALRPLSGHMMINVESYKKEGFWKRGRRNLRLLKAYRQGEDVSVLAKSYKETP